MTETKSIKEPSELFALIKQKIDMIKAEQVPLGDHVINDPDKNDVFTYGVSVGEILALHGLMNLLNGMTGTEAQRIETFLDEFYINMYD